MQISFVLQYFCVKEQLAIMLREHLVHHPLYVFSSECCLSVSA